jgi:hypothetical protein
MQFIKLGNRELWLNVFTIKKVWLNYDILRSGEAPLYRIGVMLNYSQAAGISTEYSDPYESKEEALSALHSFVEFLNG